MQEYQETTLTKKQLQTLKLGYNIVLVKMIHKNVGAESDGIIKVVNGQTMHDDYIYSDRYGVVVKTPSIFYDKNSEFSPDFHPHMEMRKNDMVWFNSAESLNAVRIYVDNEEYRLIVNSECYVLKRGKKILPINGHILFKEVQREKESFLDVSPDRADFRFGEICYVGKENKEYKYSETSELDLTAGDKVVFSDPYIPYLENEGFQVLNGKEMYKVCRRSEISAVVKKQEI